MLTRFDKNRITNCIIDNVIFYFYFDDKADDRERRIAKVIILDNKIDIAKALIKQLHDELKSICRTELADKVWIDVSDIYYPDGINFSKMPCCAKDDVNMRFWTEYAINGDAKFFCSDTLGRFSRRQRRFYEISNSMLSRCEIQY